MVDPYQVLGVTRQATQDEIRIAYRSLAKKYHPDLHPGDKESETRFKEVAAAYDILGDEKKRTRFDSGEIDASGAERQRAAGQTYREHAEAESGFKYRPQWEGAAFGDQEDIFADIFGRRAARTKLRGEDVVYTLSIDFVDSILGAKKRVVMADGKALDITIPPGLKDGQTLRLRGQGYPGVGGGDPGDALVEIHVKPHPGFAREGNNIRSTVPITLAEALAGGKVRVDTVAGPLTVAVPKGSNTGTVLRLRGKGVPSDASPGDHLVELQVVLPDKLDDDLVRAITEWESRHPYTPRGRQERAQ